MNIWLTVVLVVHVITALSIIGLVLLQHGKGADVGAAFGSGASGSLFGASGSANFLSRTTAALAAIFFCTSLALAYLATHRPREGGTVMDTLPASGAPAAPAPTFQAPKSSETPVPSDVPKPSDAPKSDTPAGSKANEVPK